MKISRRALLATPFVLRSLDAFAVDCDVCVIGAGAAGIAAALTLKMQGKSIKIVEAGNRVGGRLFTNNSLGGRYDAGGAYIHFADINPFTAIAQSLNMPTEPLSFGGGMRFKPFENGVALGNIALAKRMMLMARVREAIDDYEGKDKSLAQVAFDEDDNGVSAIRSTSLFSLGEEPQHVSVNDYNSLSGGRNLSLPQGYGALLEAHAKGLEVELNTHVLRVDLSGVLPKIITNKGVIVAKACIITVSIGVLQAHNIVNTPVLNKALEGFKMGALTKIAIATTGVAANFGGHAFVQEWNGDIRMSLEILPHGNPLIVAVLGGDEARKLIKAGDSAAIDYVSSRLNKIFGANAKATLGKGALHGWANDPHFHGSYALVKPGFTASRQLIREPLRDNIYIAGEATALDKSMTAGGAYLEGQRVAGLLKI